MASGYRIGIDVGGTFTDFLTVEGFQFFDLPTGMYRLTVSAKGYAQHASEIQVRAEQHESATIRMTPAVR